MAAMPGPITATQAMAQYLNALGQRYPTQFEMQQSMYAPQTQQQGAGLLGQAAQIGTSYGVKKGLEALLSSGASSAVPSGAGAVEAALAQGIYQTPMSTVQTVAPGLGSAAGSTAGTAASSAPTSISNFAGSATPYLGAAGTAAGAYAAYQGIKDKNPLTAGLGGLGAGLGINAMGYALGPYGWAAMLAAPAIGALVNKLGDKDRWKTEKKKLEKLQKSGAFIPENLLASMPTRGRSMDELIRKDLAADFVGRDTQGNWANNLFAKSRLESDLRPEDIVGYAAFAEKDKDWFNKPLETRLAEAKKALDANAVREAKGSITVDWNKVAGALANAQ